MAKSNIEKGLFAPVKTSKISDEVYKQIVFLISNGQLKPGDKIPSERELSSELGISRQSIREALNRAEVMGLIDVRQGEGSFILSSLKGSLKPPLTVIIEEEVERVFEFLEIRKIIQGFGECVRALQKIFVEHLLLNRDLLFEERVENDRRGPAVLHLPDLSDILRERRGGNHDGILECKSRIDRRQICHFEPLSELLAFVVLQGGHMLI